jgi:hypothetical protein
MQGSADWFEAIRLITAVKEKSTAELLHYSSVQQLNSVTRVKRLTSRFCDL